MSRGWAGRLAVSAIALVLFAGRARGEEPKVQVLAPGFRVQPLPVALTNANGLAFGPDGRLYVLGYDGRIHTLIDSDGDEIEDRAVPYWDKEPFLSPIAMVWGPKGLYVASHQRISLLIDEDRDGRADRADVVASGWPKVPTGSNLIDVMGLAFDREGALYANIGCADFTNPYLVRDGKAHYSRKDETGVILKFAPDLKSREIYATGLRFNYALRFNKAGDLFGTEQEGATWLEGANVLDEVNHLQAGKHYGWPPRHPEHLPDVIDEPPTVGFDPQHASACGMVFNEPADRQALFGPTSWEGDAFVALFSRGRINRVRLVKTEAGHVGQSTPFATMNRMPSDVAISPNGSMYVALHSGLPDWGTGPQGEGHIVRLSYVDAEAPQAVAAWSAGPLDVRVAFDRPIDPGVVSKLPGAKIAFGTHLRAGDRFEAFKPPYKVVEQQLAAPRGTIAIAAARLEDAGRTLALTTDPQPWDANYVFAVPGVRGGDADLEFGMRGVAATWQAEGSEIESSLWWPHLDLSVSRRFAQGSAPHAAAWEQLEKPGLLTLRSLIRAPGAKLFLDVKASGPLVFEELLLDGVPATLADDKRSARVELDRTELPASLELIVRTGASSNGRAALSATYHTDLDPTERPLQPHQLVLPWAPPAPPAPPAGDYTPPGLEGADAARGARVFAGEEAKCASCHLFRGQGKAVGPDLSNLHERDVASIFRDIAEPSATINPDYVPYTVALKDGRVLAGIVKTEGEDRLRVTDTNAQTTEVLRSEIEELRPTATSIMPVGIAGALGEAKMKDLVKYLTAPK